MKYTEDASAIPFPKIVKVDGEEAGACYYACPESEWAEHLLGWQRVCRVNKTAPAPWPEGHLMFEVPEEYGCIRWGDTSPDSRRRAIRSSVAGMLAGWDGFLYDSLPRAEAERKREAIINATVEAKMAGKETGAAPFMAMVWAGI